MSEHSKAPEKRHAQRILASEMTSLIHGADELASAISQTEALFSTKLTKEYIDQMSLSDFEKHFENYTKHEISMIELDQLKSFINLVHHLGLRKTKADARRLIAQKGF